MQFAPDDPALLDRLPVLAQPVDLTAVGSTQLRMEGIDALELHYSGSHQPRPLADQARDALMGGRRGRRSAGLVADAAGCPGPGCPSP